MRPSRPLQLSLSPLSSPGGGIPAHHPIRRKQGPRQGIPLLQPCHGPCIFPSALGQGRRRPFPLPQGAAPPLLILVRCFLFRPHVFSFSVHRLPLHRSTDLSGRRPALQSPGSRRGVAPFRLGAPPAAPFSPALPRGYRRPSGPGCAPPFRSSASRARPPRWGSRSCLRGRPDDRCAATGPPLRHLVLSFCPVPADLTALGLPVLGRCGRLRDRMDPQTLRSAASVWCSGPSADRRFALTALALRLF